jgi:thymidine kinase
MNNTNNMTSTNNSAYLELIIGPMYSGKTSKLLEIYKQCQFCDIPVAVINHSLDNRYDDEMLSTHDKVKIPCFKTDKLMNLWIDKFNLSEIDIIPRFNDKIKVRKSDVILINEGQFFGDLIEFVKLLLLDNKKIYICGLDGDFERKKFGNILDLIPLSDKVTKLTSLCSICKNGTAAIFSLRLTRETEQTIIGSENYIPVCRSCYEKNTHH